MAAAGFEIILTRKGRGLLLLSALLLGLVFFLCGLFLFGIATLPVQEGTILAVLALRKILAAALFLDFVLLFSQATPLRE